MLSMVLEKKYDATPLQVLTDKQTRERVQRLAAAMSEPGEKVSQAELFRRILDEALPVFEARYGLG